MSHFDRAAPRRWIRGWLDLVARAFALANSPLQAKPRTVTFVTIAVVLLVLLIGYWWPPIMRTQAYFSLINDFQKATAVEPASREQRAPEWDMRYHMTDHVVATVHGRTGMDVISVRYSDESQPRKLYSYVDYSNPLAVRKSGDVLYVHWEEILFRSDHWLLAYDLRNRREVARRRIDPDDLVAGVKQRH